MQNFVNELDSITANRYNDRRPLTEKADPLALSWAAYAVWLRDPTRRFVPFTDIEAHDHDHDMAKATRKYYRDRLAMDVLRNNRDPSQFRQDLYDICNSGIMRHCHLGMIYRLPYFYVEDTSRQELLTMFPHTPRTRSPVPRLLKIKETRTLTTVDRIFHSRRGRETVEYWFRDEEQHPVMTRVTYANELRLLADGIFGTAGRQNRLQGFYTITRNPTNDFYYWYLDRMDLIFDEKESQ